MEWFVDICMSSQVLPTTPHNVGLKPSVPGHKLAGCQIIKLIHLHTTREVQIRTGYLPVDLLFAIDSLLHWTRSTVNLEMKHREKHVCSNDTTNTRKRACNRRNTERRNTGRHHERYSIVIQIRIDVNREYRISIHIRIDNNREYCIAIQFRNKLEIDTILPEYESSAIIMIRRG